MWYFAWILGVLLACAFGIINVLWLEAQEGLQQDQIILDPLTRTPSRIEFLDLLEQKIEQYGNEPPPFSLLLIGMDALSAPEAGRDGDWANELVVQFSQLIQNEIRLPLDAVARYDAATFAVILNNSTLETAGTVAERICNRARAMAETKNLQSGLSIGVCEYLESTEPGEASPQQHLTRLLESTDIAMKNAAGSNDDRFSYFCV